MVRRDKRGSFYIVLHVEECYGVEHPRDVKVAIKQISGHFNLKIENELLDYVSCEICFDRNKEKAWLSQPSHLLKKMEEKIGKMVQSNQTYRSPGTPGGFGIRSLKEDDKAISREDQTFHRSGVGMVLYLVKHTRPDISNVVRELSKILSWATEAALKELKRVIKFVLDTKTFGLKVEQKMDKENVNWALTVFTHSIGQETRTTEEVSQDTWFAFLVHRSCGNRRLRYQLVSHQARLSIML
jgi:hypothetical protein